MAVTKEITRLEKSNVKLSVTIPREDVRAQYDGLLKDYAKNLQLPGFRKGKVPKEVLERKFAEALKGETLGRIIDGTLQDIFKEENLPRNEKPLPYAAPELDGEPEIDFEKDLHFSVIYDVLPDVKIGQWKGLSVEYPYAEITDNEINKELEEIRERNAIVMDRDDSAAAQKGDVVTIDYQIYEENGEAPPDMQRKDFAFTLGANSNVYQFDDDIIGMKKGETKEFEKEFHEDPLDRTSQGKTKKVRITLTALKEKKLPDLDDDLAQDVDEKFHTLDDLKNSIKEKLNKNLEWRLREKKISETLKKIMENTPVLLPETMVQAEIQSRWQRLARYYNTSVESMIQLLSGNNGREAQEEEWRTAAERALHSRLIIETLLEEQNVEVTDEDLENEFKKQAEENGVEIDEVKKRYREQDIFYLKEDIKERKVTDMLLTENTLKPGKKENYLDFMSDNG